jgi:hypothetical protein
MVMEMHTPGPWTWGEGYLWAGSHMLFWPTKDETIKVLSEADARLIAAAPDLLDACKAALVEVQRTISSHTSFNNTMDVLEAAIAKAEGR